jgi:hypothetical protein
VWISVKDGDQWSEPRPAGGEVNREGYTNYVVFTSDGCSVVYIRNFSQFEIVSLEALMEPARDRD